jgi:hypothetical protein
VFFLNTKVLGNFFEIYKPKFDKLFKKMLLKHCCFVGTIFSRKNSFLMVSGFAYKFVVLRMKTKT